jgi:hypothetical protein
MAIEMCKLSLWLVSLDPRLPFSFVDDKILHGNSLLGLTSVEQLEYQHIYPDAADRRISLLDVDIDDVLKQASRLRQRLASPVNDTDPQRSTMTKRRQWRHYQDLTGQLADIADTIVGAGLRLGGKPGRPLNTAYQNLRYALGEAHPNDSGESRRDKLEDILTAGLTPTVPTDYDRWKPLH